MEHEAIAEYQWLFLRERHGIPTWKNGVLHAAGLAENPALGKAGIGWVNEDGDAVDGTVFSKSCRHVNPAACFNAGSLWLDLADFSDEP